MSKVVVLGAGLTGLATAMLLAGDGHRVVVVEGDREGPPDDARSAWDVWARRGPSQFRMLHYMLPRWRQLMRRELPRVLDRLVDAGAARFNPVRSMPARRSGGWRQGDERFDTVTARRPVLEAAFALEAEDTPGVSVVRGTRVHVLVPGVPRIPGVPHVAGVVAGGRVLGADVVVDAGGRRSALPTWLGALGARPPAEWRADSGFVYYARHFRSPDGIMPPLVGPILQHHDSLSVLTLPADNGTWAVGLAVSSKDRAMRALRDPDTWDAVAARYPLAAPWLADEPTTGVDVMAGNEDRRRELVVEGTPVATGVLAVGDAWASTNPTLGRGATIGLQHASCLRDLVREVGTDDQEKLARRWAEVTDTVVRPLYEQTVAVSTARLAEMEADRRGERVDAAPGWWLAKALDATAGSDPDVLRAALDLGSLLATPTEVFARPGLTDVLGPVAATRPGYTLPGPTRAELSGTVAGTRP